MGDVFPPHAPFSQKNYKQLEHGRKRGAVIKPIRLQMYSYTPNDFQVNSYSGRPFRVTSKPLQLHHSDDISAPFYFKASNENTPLFYKP